MIEFQDNTIRDGMQQRNIRKDLKTKLKILNLIKTTNIESVEVGMCATREDFHLISQESKKLGESQKMVVLTRLIHEDIKLTCKLANLNKNLVIKLLVPISELHIVKKLGCKKEDILKNLRQSLNYISNRALLLQILFQEF
ncbi:hypothetical protein [Clostridium estertheticum]|uniref:Pyruvate carboxyltransferase domain-containing protein n=1 Tax=Clostridium estertheticum TaxID=238834 RepID=A0AA47I7Z7_9CLOT|nr:hypothetical protein [Clostridium estertheticum]MBU3157598.1 hypothetical protein [Clostridium estertheticum]WAG63217.1 hypothetical protein LL038_25085 [Clostridium estertheticum]